MNLIKIYNPLKQALIELKRNTFLKFMLILFLILDIYLYHGINIVSLRIYTIISLFLITSSFLIISFTIVIFNTFAKMKNFNTKYLYFKKLDNKLTIKKYKDMVDNNNYIKKVIEQTLCCTNSKKLSKNKMIELLKEENLEISKIKDIIIF